MIVFLLIHLIVSVQCLGRQIGTVQTARFTSVDGLNSDSVWLYNKSSSQQCLCTVLSSYTSTLLFNSYSNGSCQLFFLLPYTYTMERNINSTIILLSSLPSTNLAPCCSNLSWLMTRIKNSSLPVLTMTQPTYLAIDDLDYLGIISYNNQLFRYNRTNMAFVTSKTITSQCMAITYYNKQYFVGCGTGGASKLYILSTATLTSIKNITVASEPRDVVFIRNGSVMIASLAGTNQLAFYNVTSPTSYIQTSLLNAPNTPYTLYRVNDTFLYMVAMSSSTPIYTLTYNQTANSWSWGTVPGTTSTPSTYNFQTTFDACGRMWLSVKGYGIRIFDSTGTRSLYNWTVSNGLNTIALTNKFDLYAADFINSRVLSYRPGILQCTS